MIRVAIVEDDLDTLQEMSDDLRATEGLLVVAGSTSCDDARRTIPDAAPDVVIVDLVLPDGTGAGLIAELRNRLPKAEFLVLSAYEDYDRIYTAILAGATGYLGKAYGREDLPRAVRDIHAGGSPMSAPIARKVIQAFHSYAAQGTPFEGLTPREQDVLHILVTGRRYQDIADALCISLETVRTHVRNIYKKLQVTSRAELMRLRK